MDDNYAYFVLDKQSGRVVVVDPVDPNLLRSTLILKSFVKENDHFGRIEIGLYSYNPLPSRSCR